MMAINAALESSPEVPNDAAVAGAMFGGMRVGIGFGGRAMRTQRVSAIPMPPRAGRWASSATRWQACLPAAPHQIGGVVFASPYAVVAEVFHSPETIEQSVSDWALPTMPIKPHSLKQVRPYFKKYIRLSRGSIVTFANAGDPVIGPTLALPLF